MTKENAINLIAGYFSYYRTDVLNYLAEFDRGEVIALAHEFIDAVEVGDSDEPVNPNNILLNGCQLSTEMKGYLFMLVHLYNLDCTAESITSLYWKVFKERQTMTKEKLDSLVNLCNECYSELIEEDNGDDK